MLDIELLRNGPDVVRDALAKRGMDAGLLDRFTSLDGEWRSLVQALDAARHELNELSRARDVEAARSVKDKVKHLEADARRLEGEREELLYQFPNIPAEGVPVGKDDSANVVIREVGARTEAKRDYLTLAEELDLIDVKKSGEVSGSRFGYLKRELALLEFALVKLVFDTVVPKGFIPVIPPVMIKPEPYRRMSRLAGDQREERYHLEKDNLYLVGSSEHTIGPLHMDETLEERDLPRRYVAFSTCFRREAGSSGKDTKGILRVHQFDKVEMFVFTAPERSEEEHQFLLAQQEEIMQKLGLPYRVVQNSTGDMGFTDAKQFDIEAWIPSEGRYRETHSCSNTTDFQARGINCRYKPTSNLQPPTSRFVHMLNATGVAIGRMLIAILENCQTKKGTVKVPKVLQKYAGFREIKRDTRAQDVDRN